MSQPSCQRTLTQFSATLENCSPPSNSLEGSPSTISPGTFVLSPNENDVDCDLLQGKYDASEDDSILNKSSCFTPHFPLPEELIDFVNSYAFSDKNHVSIEEMLCHTLDLPGTLSSSDILRNSSSSPPISQQSCKKSHPSSSSFHRLHHVADGDRQSKKRKLNRDAAFRYRQKVKVKNEKLQGELNAAIQAFKDARKLYEIARGAFDALKKVVVDMVVVNVPSCHQTHSILY
ncbi:expressed conserved protein [Echinococcus multilocularis]|uniref:Expressed conserved protein n=1 Tax=Echinococcus multilocularis TaxID=6211 RepID=A0A087VWX7_ECHMU|nr:expressed conserved protein [Echinococcus multilocularis]